MCLKLIKTKYVMHKRTYEIFQKMNVKSKNDKRKAVKSLPSIDLNSIAIRPPNPPPVAPNIPTINSIVSSRTPNRVPSPKDDTELMVNGRLVNMDSEINNRINYDEDEEISPETPPKQTYSESGPKMIETNLTPNRYIPNEIKIIESPNNKRIESLNSNSRYDIKPIPMKQLNKDRPEVETISDVDDSPRSAFTSFTTKTAKTGKTGNTNKTSKSLFNMLPKFNKTSAPTLPTIKSSTPDTLPRVKSPANPYQFIQDIKEPQDEHHEDAYSESSEESWREGEFPAVKIPIPVFNTVPRVVSPIQTIGAYSPSVKKNVKPNFTENGKSSTPRRYAPSPIRAKTPPPIFRSPPKRASSPVHDNIKQDIKTPQTQVPKENHFYIAPQQSSGLTNRPDYSRLTPPQILYLKSEFKVKFGILREKFPNLNVIDLHESLDLDQMHDLYDYYIKHILISKETGQYKAYMVIFLMFIEVIGVKLLKLNMSGYTLSQLRIINRYDSLFAELGEKWLVSGGSGWPVEARLMMMMLFNAVIFLVVRYLCSWLGVEGLADTLQNMIDKMLNGPDIMGSVIGGGAAPVGAPPNNDYVPTEQPHVSQPTEASTGANPIDGIMNAFSGFLSKNGNSITETIANIGTSITGKMQNTNNINKTNASKAKEPPSSNQTKKKKKSLFSED